MIFTNFVFSELCSHFMFDCISRQHDEVIEILRAAEAVAEESTEKATTQHGMPILFLPISQLKTFEQNDTSMQEQYNNCHVSLFV